MRPLSISSALIILTLTLVVCALLDVVVEFNKVAILGASVFLLVVLITAPVGFCRLLKEKVSCKRKIFLGLVHVTAFAIAASVCLGWLYLVLTGGFFPRHF